MFDSQFPSPCNIVANKHAKRHLFSLVGFFARVMDEKGIKIVAYAIFLGMCGLRRRKESSMM